MAMKFDNDGEILGPLELSNDKAIIKLLELCNEFETAFENTIDAEFPVEEGNLESVELFKAMRISRFCHLEKIRDTLKNALYSISIRIP